MPPRSLSGQSLRGLQPPPPAAASRAQAGAVGASRVCRYYLAGECKRADCRFSHDLSRALCRFWLKGQCLNDPCSFLHDHDLVNNLASGLASTSISTPTEPLTPGVETPPATADDFPTLGGSSSGGAARSSGWATPPKVLTGPDPSRARFAAALQRRQMTPAMAAVQAGDAAAFVPMQPRSAPARPAASTPSQIPTGPRAASRIALRAPTLLPTLKVGQGASSSYASSRNTSLQISEERNRALARASEAWKRGDGAAARKWSQEGAALNERLAEENRSAAEQIIKERHLELRERLLNTGSDGGGWGGGASASEEPGARGLRGKLVGNGLGVCLGVARKESVPGGLKLDVEERTESFLDLHGLVSAQDLGVRAASESTSSRRSTRRRRSSLWKSSCVSRPSSCTISNLAADDRLFTVGLERESMRGLAYFACGKGQHSSTSTDRRHVKLAGACKAFLGGWGYPFADWEGVLIVDPLTHQ